MTLCQALWFIIPLELIYSWCHLTANSEIIVYKNVWTQRLYKRLKFSLLYLVKCIDTSCLGQSKMGTLLNRTNTSNTRKSSSVRLEEQMTLKTRLDEHTWNNEICDTLYTFLMFKILIGSQTCRYLRWRISIHAPT